MLQLQGDIDDKRRRARWHWYGVLIPAAVLGILLARLDSDLLITLLVGLLLALAVREVAVVLLRRHAFVFTLGVVVVVVLVAGLFSGVPDRLDAERVLEGVMPGPVERVRQRAVRWINEQTERQDERLPGTPSSGTASNPHTQPSEPLSAATTSLGGGSATSRRAAALPSVAIPGPGTRSTERVQTTVWLSLVPEHPAPGQKVTFTATVKASSGDQVPGGTVEFWRGTLPLGRAVLTPAPGGASASLTAVSPSPGSHLVTATYLGSPRFGPSRCQPLLLMVDAR